MQGQLAMDQMGLGEYCDQATSLVENGRFDQALRIARYILHHYPGYIEGHRLLGQALLGTGRYQEAADQFVHVLAADPENVAARIGLSRVYQAAGDWDKTIDQMQRAFDLSPNDPTLRRQLSHLIEAHSPQPAGGAEITRAALGRIYVRNGLHAKAIQEFRAVLAHEPDRHDVLLSLAEVLWRDGYYRETVEVCHRVLDSLPNALKANLIIGALWRDSPQPEESQPYLALANTLDPENAVAASLFSERSPLAPLAVKIEKIEEQSVPRSIEEKVSESHKEGTAPMSDQIRPEEDFEIPDWLKGVEDELLAEEDAPATSPSAAQAAETGTPRWLRALVSRADEAAAAESPPVEEVGVTPGEVPSPATDVVSEGTAEAGLPDWLTSIPLELEAGLPPVPVGEAVPGAPQATVESEAGLTDWLDRLAETETVAPSESIPEAEIPEWLKQISQGMPVTPVKAELPVVDIESADLPEWLREPSPQEEIPARLKGEAEQPVEAVPQAEILPDWLQEAAPQEEIPAWLKEEAGQPTEVAAASSELPDWLKAVAAGKPLEEAERPVSGETQIPVWLTEDTQPAALVLPAEEKAAGAAEEAVSTEIPAWLQELQQPVPAPAEPISHVARMAAPVSEEIAEVSAEAELPDWLRRLREGVGEEARAEQTQALEAEMAALSAEAVASAEPPTGEIAQPVMVIPQEAAPLAQVVEMLPEPEIAEELVVAAAPAVGEVTPTVTPVVEEIIPAAAPVIVEEAAPAEISLPPAAEEVIQPELVSPEALVVAAPALAEEPTKDPAGCLVMARAAMQADNWSEALSLYGALVNSSDLLDAVISDLEEGIKKYPDDYAGYQLAGDAYMKDGRLPLALRAYRTALAKLNQ